MLMLPERSYSTLDYVHHCDALSLLRALADKSVDAIITDMPYGSTECAWDTPIDLVQWWVEVKRVIKPRGVMVTTAAQPFTSALVMSNPAWFKYEWIWEKSKGANFSSTAYQPLKVTESVPVFSAAPATFNKSGHHLNYYPQKDKRERPYTGKFKQHKRGGITAPLRKNKITSAKYSDITPRNIIYAATDGDGRIHPTQKPVALYEYLIQTYTRPGELVLDPFSGSGTTAIAARKTGRHFICGDSSAEYVEMSRKRLATTDPYQHRPLPDGRKQLSMFAGVMA